MINPEWFELPMSRTNFHGPNDVRTIEVRLYVQIMFIATDKIRYWLYFFAVQNVAFLFEVSIAYTRTSRKRAVLKV